MHMMSKLKYTAAALALCAAWSAHVGLRVSGMRPEGCTRGRLLRCTPLQLSGRALHARCARGMACVQKERVAARRCTFIGRICALAATGSARKASLGPLDSAPPRRVRFRGACRRFLRSVGHPRGIRTETDDADGPTRVRPDDQHQNLRKFWC
ncbi:hypothetical protein T492DRAFT_941349 [Pavlovales sp. CCMP2436]|nr:hypothetical protein T492DRAFT_941349 [Pavlovales sp. CCMP2436]